MTIRSDSLVFSFPVFYLDSEAGGRFGERRIEMEVDSDACFVLWCSQDRRTSM